MSCVGRQEYDFTDGSLLMDGKRLKTVYNLTDEDGRVIKEGWNNNGDLASLTSGKKTTSFSFGIKTSDLLEIYDDFCPDVQGMPGFKDTDYLSKIRFDLNWTQQISKVSIWVAIFCGCAIQNRSHNTSLDGDDMTTTMTGKFLKMVSSTQLLGLPNN